MDAENAAEHHDVEELTQLQGGVEEGLNEITKPRWYDGARKLFWIVFFMFGILARLAVLGGGGIRSPITSYSNLSDVKERIGYVRPNSASEIVLNTVKYDFSCASYRMLRSTR